MRALNQTFAACGCNFLQQLGVGIGRDLAKPTKGTQIPEELMQQQIHIYHSNGRYVILGELNEKGRTEKLHKVGASFQEKDKLNQSAKQIVFPDQKPNTWITEVCCLYEELYVLTSDSRIWHLDLNSTTCKAQHIDYEELKDKRIKQMRGGYNHAVILTEDLEVYAVGRGSQGQLATKVDLPLNRAIKIDTSSLVGPVLRVEAGTHKTFLLTASKIYACGKNAKLELGVGESDPSISSLKPVKLPVPASRVRSITCNSAQTFFLVDDSTLYVAGQVFDMVGKYKTSSVPVLFDSMLPPHRIEKICSPNSFNLAVLNENKEIYVVGINGNGELAIGEPSPCYTFQKVDLSSFYPLVPSQIEFGFWSFYIMFDLHFINTLFTKSQRSCASPTSTRSTPSKGFSDLKIEFL